MPVIGLSEERVAGNSENFESLLQAAVSLEITAEPSVVTDAGTEVVYTYTVTNVGDEILTGVKVTDNALGVINLNPSVIEPEGTAVGTGNYIVFQDDIDAGVGLVNTATAESAQGVSDDAAVTLEIIQLPSVLLEKTADETNVFNEEDVITYNYTVTNDGNVTLNNIVVTDDPLGPISMDATTLAPAETTVGSAIYEVTLADFDAGGTIYNQATVITDKPATDSDDMSVIIIQEALVQLDKTADRQSVSTLEEVITYTYEVTNIGNVTLNNVTVTDDPLGVISMDAATLAPTETTVGSAAYEVTLADLNTGGDIFNEAIVTTDEGASAIDNASVSVIQEASVQIENTADKTGVSSEGEIITYTYLVTNNGDVTLNNVTVTDDLPGTVTMEPIILEPGGTSSGSAAYTVTQDDINSGTAIVNSATVTTDEGATATDDASVPVNQAASVQIENTADKTGVSSEGEIITYTYLVTNNGNVTLNNVTVTDELPGTVTMEPIILEPGGTSTGSAAYTVTQDDINSGTAIVNSATVTTDEGATATDAASVPVNQAASVQIENTADKTGVSSEGEIITYTYLVTNNGNVTLNNVTVTDDLPGTVTMEPIILEPGGTSSGSAAYIVTQDDLNSGTAIVNSATVTTDEGATATDDASVSVSQSASVQIQKTADKTGVSFEGEIITYTYLVTNNGNVTLNNITVTDDKLGTITMNATTLAPGENTSGTDTYTITQEDINSGSAIVNTATVTADEDATATDNASVSVSQSVSVQIEKTADKTGVSTEGEIITYTYLVTNNGNVSLTNIVVNDDKLGEISLDATILPPGETASGTASYTVTQADINSGSPIVNTATVTTDEEATATDDASVPVSQSASVQIEKTADKTSVSSEGEIITYTYLVTNDGNITLTNVVVNDDKLGAISLDATTLPPGETASGTAAYTVTQNDINAGNDIVNVATVTSDEGVSNTDNATVTINQQSGLGIEKTATTSGFSEVGDVINYSIEVTNSGNLTLDVTVTDPLTGMSETLNDFAPGSSQTFTTSYTVQQSDLNAGSVTNVVTASDGNSLNVSDQVTVSGAMNPGISITKTASPTTYSVVGAIINYDIVVENTGNVNLTNVVVTDQMLALDETIEDLAPGAAVSFEGTYIIAQVDLNNGSLDNTAYVSGNDPDGNVVSDSDQVSVTANQNADIAVTKAASPITFASVGDEITYTITVENTGNVILTGVVVSDPLTGMEETIALFLPGQTETFIQTLSINQSHLNSGTLTNTVTAEGNGPLFARVSDSDEVTVTASQTPGISVNKTAKQETYKAVGDQVNYTIVVENTGNVTLTDVAVSDPLTQMNESVGNLAPGEERSFSTTYSIVQSDLDQGTVINTVTASATLGGEIIEADAEAVVSALFPPVANDDISADHLSGNIAVVNILENDLLNDGSPALPGMVTVDINLQADGVQTNLEVQGEGNWNYNSQSGELTFSPASGFTTDPAPVSYLLTENSTGLNDEASVTVDYNEGEPFAFNDSSTDNTPGETVTINILSNDKLSDGSSASSQQVTIDIDVAQEGIQTERIVAGEGTWSFNPESGEITFTPLPGFSTDPTPLTYRLIEKLTDLNDEGTVIIGYDEQPPVAGNDSSSGHNPGEAATLNLLGNDFLGDGTQALPEQVTIDVNLTRAGIQDEFESPAEGLWRLDASTGDITFTPVAGFTGNPEPLTYRLTEVLTGLADTATVTFIYSEEAPVAADDSSGENQPGTEVSINILENDLLSDGSMAEPQLVLVDFDPLTEGQQYEIVVEGQGTWMYNEVTGILTFSPENGFVDDPSPVSYTLCSVWNPQVCSEAEVIIGYRQDPSMASIGLIKTGIYFSEDETVEYSFEVTNTGSLAVWNITIADEQLGINDLQIIPDTLQPGASGIATATYQVTPEDKNRGSIVNSAVATGFILEGESLEDISGNTVDDDEPTVTVLKQLAIKKQTLGNITEALVDQEVEFSLIVNNKGNNTLTNVNIEDPLTGFEQLVGQLLPGDSVVYYTIYTVQPIDESAGEFINTAVATGMAADGSLLTDSSSVIVNVVETCEMVIPNGFSPNDDGIQDVWEVSCLENYPNARVEIFNRWGNKVFEKENFGNTDVHGIADAWWDGYSTSKRTFGSGRLPAGTYYYILYLQPGQEPLNGFIFLNR